MTRSYAEYFQNAFMDKDAGYNNMGYIKSHCDTFGFCSSGTNYSLANSNVIGRVRNCLVKAINDQILLLKHILLVLETDLIKAADHYTDGISTVIGQMAEWVVNQMHRLIMAHKEKLATKARKFKYPQIFWIAAVHHVSLDSDENFYRKKVNLCLYKVAAMYQEVNVLMLHTWDAQDRALISDGWFTAKGYKAYWESIDAAFQKFEKDQLNQLHHSKKTTPPVRS